MFLYLHAGDVSGTFSVDLDEFSPGLHKLNIVGVAEDGQVSDVSPIEFNVVEPLGEILAFMTMLSTFYF